MPDLPFEAVRRLIAAANAARIGKEASARGEPTQSLDAERRLDDLFETRHTLAVYGSLAPGRSNHRVVAPLEGEWSDGVIEGDLFPVGWGAALGYPAFRPRDDGPGVAVQLLRTTRLAAAWPMLDRFEGPDYRRVLVAVFTTGPSDQRRFHTVANVYAAVESGGVAVER